MSLCHHFDLMNFNEAKQGLVQKCNLYPLIIIFIESDALKKDYAYTSWEFHASYPYWSYEGSNSD